MNIENVKPIDVNPGDKVLPPARELSLWMRRSLAEKGLPEDALLLTVSAVIPNHKTDKNGSWTYIKTKYSMEFGGGRDFNFFVRPETTIKKHKGAN